MRTALKWIAKLEERFEPKDGGPQHLLVIRRLDVALATDRCVGILRQCGFLSGSGVVNFCKVPADLSAAQKERYLRERGAEICGPRRGTTERR